MMWSNSNSNSAGKYRWLRIALVVLLVLALLTPAHARTPKRVEDDDDDEVEVVDVDEPARGEPSKASKADQDRDRDSDDEDESLDADEFEGFVSANGKASAVPASHAPASASSHSSSSSSSADKADSSEEKEKPTYLPEMVALLFVLAYVINFFMGRSVNDQIAHKWVDTFQSMMDLQFAALGAFGSDQKGALLKDSQSSYKFYASGRRHCMGLVASLELRRRHDLFSLLLAQFDLSTVRDTVTIEIPMNPEEMEPFVFAVVPRKHEKKWRRNLKDLENFGGVVPSKQLPASLCVLSDCPELEGEFLDDLVVRTLSQYEDLFVLMHLTDQYTGPLASSFPTKKMLRFSFYLPPQTDMARLLKLTQMAVYFIDRVASRKLPAQAHARALKKRKEVADAQFRASHDQRQEAAQRRREDAKKKEEEQVANLTPEQLRKREEKKYKADLKKKQPKVKLLR